MNLYYKEFKKDLWHHSLFLSYKFYFFLIFIFLPIGLNLVFAIIQKSLHSTTGTVLLHTITANKISSLPSKQVELTLLIFLAVAQITLFIFLLWKTPNFFIKSGAIVLGFFSIFNFFAVSLVAGIVIGILHAINHKWIGTSVDTLVPTTLQVVGYLFIICYIFCFCDSVRENMLQPFCHRKQSTSSNTERNRNNNGRMRTLMKTTEKHETSSLTLQLPTAKEQYAVSPKKQLARNSRNTIMVLSWKKMTIVFSVFVIVVLALCLLFGEATSNNGSGSTTDNQNALNKIKHSGVYGVIIFIVLVSALAPIVEEAATRHGVISVLNCHHDKNTGELVQPKRSQFKSASKIMFLLFSIIISTYYFANMHIMFASYGQIKQYLVIAAVLSVGYIISNFIVGYTMLGHSAFNCAILLSQIQH